MLKDYLSIPIIELQRLQRPLVFNVCPNSLQTIFLLINYHMFALSTKALPCRGLVGPKSPAPLVKKLEGTANAERDGTQ